MNRNDSILPANASVLEVLLDLLFANRLNQIPIERIATQWDADYCPSHLLPNLAWTVSVDEWDNDWDDAIKREVIKASPVAHARKGTINGLKTALGAIGSSIAVTEWNQQPDSARIEDKTPFTFTVDVSSALQTNEKTLRKINRLIRLQKPTRSHYRLGIASSAEITIQRSAIGFAACYAQASGVCA